MTDVRVWKGFVKSAPADGYCTVRREGETVDRRVSIVRAVSTAVVGDWMLIVESDGVLWGVGLLGVGPGTAPTDPVVPPPDPSQPTQPSTISLPPVWGGYRQWTPNDGNPGTAAYFYANDEGTFSFGRVLFLTYLSERSEGMAIYSGAKGLALTAASVSWSEPSIKSQVSSSSVKVALWLAPESRPADVTGGHPAGITLVDSVNLGVTWPPPVGESVTFQLPAGWLTHLAAGTANGIGLIETATVHTGALPWMATAGALNLTYQ